MRTATLISLSILLLVVGCEDGTTLRAGVETTRSSLDNGATLVRYGGLPEPTQPPLEADLVLGVSDDPDQIFGDVRSIDARRDGTIYVLDYQAGEVQRFDADGEHQGPVLTRGDGPSEIGAANGMIFVGDSILWVQDHGRGQMLAVRPDGEEVTRLPMLALAWGYVWSGTVDERGQIWKSITHTDEQPSMPSEEGLNEAMGRLYWKTLDPTSGATDSIFVGETHNRAYVQKMGTGSAYLSIPFDPSALTVVSPSGTIWFTQGDEYRVLKLGPTGDTVTVIEVAHDPIPVTDEDRDRYLAEQAERGPRARAGARVVEFMRDTKPAIEGLVVDDMGRVWVRRTPGQDGLPVYDVFSDDGEHIETFAFNFEPARYVPIRIRFGNLYALVRDDLDVPTVVRARLPPASADS